jgi:glyoxylase-like metal-dependent hydrolase (beta-lactamase superfamily II)
LRADYNKCLVQANVYLFQKNEKPPVSKEPRAVLDSIWAFPPNRETFGGTAYFIVENSQNVPANVLQAEFKSVPKNLPQNVPKNVLIDCPSWDHNTQSFLQRHGGVQHLIITHRQGASPAAAEIQRCFGCQVWVQEQEAYLLPSVDVTSFQESSYPYADLQIFWTPGYSPGSACVYRAGQGVLFTGRHLLPDQQGNPTPLRMAKTFHWPRQLKSVREILDRFDENSLRYLCPGANTGFLRQQGFIDNAYQKLAQLDLAQLFQVAIGV